MEYSCSAYELKCNECGRRVMATSPSLPAPTAWLPLESCTTTCRQPARNDFTRANIVAGPFNIWRYKLPCCPFLKGFEPDLPSRLYPAGEGEAESREAHRRQQSLHQE